MRTRIVVCRFVLIYGIRNGQAKTNSLEKRQSRAYEMPSVVVQTEILLQVNINKISNGDGNPFRDI